MKRIVFAGPSLFGADLDRYENVTVLPPAKRGDLIDAAASGALVIGLIDGYFKQVPSVWHKEILLCLARGLKVYAGGSIGALRGAECTEFGVEGVGRVYKEYQCGLRTSDADVALAFAPEALHFQPLTLTVVDAEATIDQLQELDLITCKECGLLKNAVAGIHFTRRTWDTVLRASELKEERCSGLRLLVEKHFTNVKLQDALEVIAKVSHFKPEASPKSALKNGPLRISQTARALLREKGF